MYDFFQSTSSNSKKKMSSSWLLWMMMMMLGPMGGMAAFHVIHSVPVWSSASCINGARCRNEKSRKHSRLYATVPSQQQPQPSPHGQDDDNETSNTSPNEDFTHSPSSSTTLLSEVNVVYESRHEIVYDPMQERYIRQRSKPTNLHKYHRRRLLRFLSVAFVPSGVTANYYRFMQWRILQRFVNANLHVFGTQSLLLGLGIKAVASSQLGALSAALKWVLKDALGKIVRMVWAARMGMRFDSDAKRWRMRSAFIFGLGNGLEIATYIFPPLFLVFATLANCCKQISMLTSSSTRSSMFNTFRDGSRENIADVTAKGEAQVAIVDLLGIGSGVTLSKVVVGTSVSSILAVYICLQVLEIFCVYRQLRCVQYKALNLERLLSVLTDFYDNTNRLENSTIAIDTIVLPTPFEMGRTERMFLPPKTLFRRQVAFGSLGRSKLSPEELRRLFEIFQNERFLLVVGANCKNPKRCWHRQRNRRAALAENCHVVLHSKATTDDIVKSALALTMLRQKLAKSHFDPYLVRSSDCYDMLEGSLRYANVHMTTFMRALSNRGWESPTRSLLGRVRTRTEWPLITNVSWMKNIHERSRLLDDICTFNCTEGLFHLIQNVHTNHFFYRLAILKLSSKKTTTWNKHYIENYSPKLEIFVSDIDLGVAMLLLIVIFSILLLRKLTHHIPRCTSHATVHLATITASHLGLQHGTLSC